MINFKIFLSSYNFFSVETDWNSSKSWTERQKVQRSTSRILIQISSTQVNIDKVSSIFWAVQILVSFIGNNNDCVWICDDSYSVKNCRRHSQGCDLSFHFASRSLQTVQEHNPTHNQTPHNSFERERNKLNKKLKKRKFSFWIDLLLLLLLLLLFRKDRAFFLTQERLLLEYKSKEFEYFKICEFSNSKLLIDFVLCWCVV
jgi:hypothetical protein